jgi:hypothetical protein
MPYQAASTVIAPVRAGAVDDLKALLAEMGDGVANGSVIDFGVLSGVHFARLFVIDEDESVSGEPLPAHLVLLADLDVARDAHLAELVDAVGDGIDRVFGHCADYPAGRPTRDERLAYLRRHVVKEAARYVNTTGRTARQIRQEAQLRAAIDDYLDTAERDWSREDPGTVRRSIQELVERDPQLAWAREPAERPGALARLRELAHAIAIPLVLIPLLPLTLVGAPIYVLLVRRHELRDHAPHEKPSDERVREIAALEDHLVHNPFTAVGHVKPARIRRLSLITLMFLLDYVTRHLFNRGTLSGVKTIHFARWVFVDGRRRMFFASNYDGSHESYMDDFIDKVAWGLNLIFSNGVGYPATRWLVFGGARHEDAFKDYQRMHQVPTHVWYSAYGRLTALDIARNERIRAGLYGDLSRNDERAWVQSL